MSPRLIILIATALVVLGLAGAVQYYRAESLANEVKVTQLSAQVDTLTAANAGLKKQAEQVKAEVERYITAVNKMGEVNTTLNAKLQASRAKFAQHKLLTMRNGRHSELLLKAINRSSAKLQNEWMTEGIQ